jgi:hypothetical protein
MHGDAVVFGPPRTLGSGAQVVRVIAAYRIGSEVGVLVDASGAPSPSQPPRPDPFVEAVHVVLEDGTTQPCVCLGGVTSGGDQRLISVSTWDAPAESHRLRLSVHGPEGIDIVELVATAAPR